MQIGQVGAYYNYGMNDFTSDVPFVVEIGYCVDDNGCLEDTLDQEFYSNEQEAIERVKEINSQELFDIKQLAW